MPQSSPRKQGLHTAGGAVEAIGEGTPHLVRWLMLEGSALIRTIGLREGCCTCGVAVPQVPDHAATDHRGQIHLVSQTTTMLFIGQDVRRQRQPTPREYHDHTVLAKGAD